MAAYRLLAGILEAPKQTSEQDAILPLLAAMQGVHRLSNLLCPTLALKDACLGHLMHTCKLCLCLHLLSCLFLATLWPCTFVSFHKQEMRVC